MPAKSDPENEELLHILGTYGSGTRRLDDYENLYRDLLKRKPDSLVAKKKLIELFIVKGELQEAGEYVREIGKARPTDTDALYCYGRFHLAEKEYNRAAEEFSQVTQDRRGLRPPIIF